MKKNEAGFSLIELLIVVAIILIIAAIAIPNLLKSKMAADQSSAVASLRTINTCEVTYSSTYNQGFTSSLAQLGPPAGATATSAAAGLVDSVLAAGTKSGYTFTYAAGAAAADGTTPTYTVNANPITAGTTGQNYYFTDESNVIRQNSTAAASASDSPIGG
jgi:type IV pilus assembly protein PilA